MATVKFRSLEQSFGLTRLYFTSSSGAGAAAVSSSSCGAFSAGGTRSLFFEIRENDGEDKFFLSVVVELLSAIYSSLQERTLPKPNLGMVDLRALSEGGFCWP